MLCVPIDEERVILAVSQEADAFTDDDRDVTARIGDIVGTVAGPRMDDRHRHPRKPTAILEEITRLTSHDISNTNIITQEFLQLADQTGEPQNFETAERSLAELQSLAKIVDSLARSRRARDEMEQVTLHEIAEDVFLSFEDSVTDLVIDTSETIFADHECLARILDNLFRNATDHSDGSVTIEIGPTGDRFYVADDGPRVPEELHEDVFTAGFSTATNHEGSGARNR